MMETSKSIWRLVVMIAVVLAIPLRSNPPGSQNQTTREHSSLTGPLWERMPSALEAYLANASASHGRSETRIPDKAPSLQIPFVENQGQVDEAVAYYAETFAGAAFVTHSGQMVYWLPTSESKGAEAWVIRESFLGASISEARGEHAATTRVNYFKGSDHSKWATDIPAYELVTLGEIYDGVELKLSAHRGSIEKVFHVRPYAEPENIRTRVEGAMDLTVNERGELEVQTGLGVVRFSKPSAFQEKNGRKRYVKVAYLVRGNEYSFNTGEYDRSQELVIDPLLASTFIGGGGYDAVNSMVIDDSGNIYVAGKTCSSDFPTTTGAYDTTYGASCDAFAAKLDIDLQELLASTYLGGSHWEEADSVAIDRSGNVYVAGGTWSSDLPATSGAYDMTYSDCWLDGFVSKLSGDLSELLASTYLGGCGLVDSSGGYDRAYTISLDASGNVLVAGKTSSLDFPATIGAYDTSCGTDGQCDYDGTFTMYHDAFVSKLDGNLSDLLASTFLGGSRFDDARSIAVDSSGNVYVAGNAASEFPVTSGAYDTTYNGKGDAFVARLDSDLENLLASTFLGGGADDEIVFSMSTDTSGNVYAAGWTKSSDFPATEGAYDTTYHSSPVAPAFDGKDAFVSKLDSGLSNLLASTFLGRAGDEIAYSMSIDSSGNIYVAGQTGSSDFPATTGSYDTSCGTDGLCDGGHFDAFAAKLDSHLSNLLASTFLGGEDDDQARALSIDANGTIYAAGWTQSSAFPVTSGAYDTTYDGSGYDAFVSKFDSALSGDVTYAPDITVSPTSHDFGIVAAGTSSAVQTLTISNTGDADLVIGTLSIAGTDASEFGTENDNCSAQTIRPTAGCTVGAVFEPASTSTKTAHLTISSNDPDTPNLSIPLTGTGGLGVMLPLVLSN